MIIYFSPISMFAAVEYSVSGDSIVVNGTTHALSTLIDLIANEQPLPEFVVSATEDSVTLLLPYWGEASEAVRFPEPIIDPPDGHINLPR